MILKYFYIFFQQTNPKNNVHINPFLTNIPTNLHRRRNFRIGLCTKKSKSIYIFELSRKKKYIQIKVP